jgi:hypothetical protein
MRQGVKGEVPDVCDLQYAVYQSVLFNLKRGSIVEVRKGEKVRTVLDTVLFTLLLILIYGC